MAKRSIIDTLLNAEDRMKRQNAVNQAKNLGINIRPEQAGYIGQRMVDAAQRMTDWNQAIEDRKPAPTITVEERPNTRGIGMDNGTLRPTVESDPYGNKKYVWEFGGAGYDKLTQGSGSFVDSILNGAGNKSKYHLTGE